MTTYLEEEVRAESLVRSVGPIARFLEYAASESGQIVKRVEPISSSPVGKTLTRTSKYLFFDGAPRLRRMPDAAIKLSDRIHAIPWQELPTLLS